MPQGLTSRTLNSKWIGKNAGYYPAFFPLKIMAEWIEVEEEAEMLIVDRKHEMKSQKNKLSHYEVVYTWPSGREEVRYRRPVTICELAKQVRDYRRACRRLNQACPYSIRRIS
jgi:hypothetical protein